jgi:N-acetylglutamate synthase/N-acetylornithine aminotransferase
MWTLIIIVVMSSVQGGSGTSSSIHSVGNFSSQQKCDDAARTIAHSGVVKGAVCTENLNPNVVMVKSAKHGA